MITDATKSPFTTVILPYKWLDNPDRKLEWNVWTFDEGLASRVPYESSARTLTQRKESFSGYTVRQGLAIVMEHNFMMSEEGIRNFQNQVQQIVNSIQNTNDLDVHQALLMAPSYLAKVREQYYLDDYLFKAMQVCVCLHAHTRLRVYRVVLLTLWYRRITRTCLALCKRTPMQWTF